MKVEKKEVPIPMQELKTLELDIEKGTLKVNGSDYSNVSFFALIFEHGVFKLSFRSDFFADGKRVSSLSDTNGLNKIRNKR